MNGDGKKWKPILIGKPERRIPLWRSVE